MATTTRCTRIWPRPSPPNADASQWTVKVRSGISFTDGTPVNADAVIDNLQRSGTGLLIAAAVDDIAKVPDPSGATNEDGSPKMILRIEKADDSTFTIFTGKGGDPAQPHLVARLRLLPHRPARPHRIADLARRGRCRRHQGDLSGRLRAVHRPELRTARRARRHQEPQLLAEGRQRRRSCRTSTRSPSRSSRTPRPQVRRCAVATSTSSRRPLPPSSPTSATTPTSRCRADRLRRDQLPADRPGQGWPVRRRSRPVRAVDGDRPPGVLRPDRGWHRCRSPTACSPLARRATSRTTGFDTTRTSMAPRR